MFSLHRGHRDGHLDRSQSGTLTDATVLYMRLPICTEGESLEEREEVGRGTGGSPQRSAVTSERTASTVDDLLHHVILEVLTCREEMCYG